MDIDALDDADLIHLEVIELQATPAQVRDFIMTPERLMAYNPGALEGGVFVPGHSVWFRTETGLTMVERVEDECSDGCVVIQAAIAPGVQPPYSAEAVRAAAMITLVEDWFLEPTETGTRVTKTWRDAAATIELPIVLADSIRETAEEETPLLVADWDAAARGA